MFRRPKRLIAAALLAVAAIAGSGAASANTITGPSNSQSPYIVSSH